MKSNLPTKTKADCLYDALAVPAQFFPPSAVIVRIIDTYWPRTYVARMDKCVKELHESYQVLEDDAAAMFSDFVKSNEGETLLIMAMESMVKTHKEEKLKNIAKTLIGVSNAQIKYDSKEYILKISTELEPFDVIVLTRILTNECDYNSIESYDEFYDAIINPNEIDKDEFFYITQKLSQLSLIRISSMLDGYNDLYSADVRITDGSGEETRPKILVTTLGSNLLSYFDQ